MGRASGTCIWPAAGPPPSRVLGPWRTGAGRTREPVASSLRRDSPPFTRSICQKELHTQTHISLTQAREWSLKKRKQSRGPTSSTNPKGPRTDPKGCRTDPEGRRSRADQATGQPLHWQLGLDWQQPTVTRGTQWVGPDCRLPVRLIVVKRPFPKLVFGWGNTRASGRPALRLPQPVLPRILQPVTG